MSIEPQLEEGWMNLLKSEFEQPYFKELSSFISAERTKGKNIYPPEEDVFNAFNYTTFEAVKVVIIGQDPYHGKGQAHGLAFSINGQQTLPPSLKNIFKELQNDLNLTIPQHGNLTKWAKEGVLLLNTVLTVEEGLPGSHQNKGWEIFTDAVIQKISLHKKGIVFLLWGKSAHDKEMLIDQSKHFTLKAAHPSPFSAYRGFFGCKHFSQTNELLVKQHEEIIDWSLEDVPVYQSRLFTV